MPNVSEIRSTIRCCWRSCQPRHWAFNTASPEGGFFFEHQVDCNPATMSKGSSNFNVVFVVKALPLWLERSICGLLTHHQGNHFDSCPFLWTGVSPEHRMTAKKLC